MLASHNILNLQMVLHYGSISGYGLGSILYDQKRLTTQRKKILDLRLYSAEEVNIALNED
jgi:hypothetical protein